jgi:probable F420-dependent oxidoreductase
MEQLTELGFYGLAGHSDSPRDLVEEVRSAEELGLGTVLISERFNLKDAPTLSGAAGAVSETLGLATAATNHNTRHPLVTATFATTMHRLTGGRFALGLGRGFDAMFRAMGLDPITAAQMKDAVDIYRRLWKGETITAHDGPAGRYPYLHQDATFNEDIPVLMVAMGEKTLEFAGSCMDAVVLHTFFGDEAMARSVSAIHRGAERAGRDPKHVRIWSVLATVGDHIEEPLRLKKTVGRLSSYLRGYGDVLVKANDWDPAVLERFRADPFVQNFQGAIDARATTEELEHLATLLPDDWVNVTATGTPEQCAATVLEQFDLGADSVCLHGATPKELEPILGAYRSIRPATLSGLPANPGWSR